MKQSILEVETRSPWVLLKTTDLLRTHCGLTAIRAGLRHTVQHLYTYWVCQQDLVVVDGCGPLTHSFSNRSFASAKKSAWNLEDQWIDSLINPESIPVFRQQTYEQIGRNSVQTPGRICSNKVLSEKHLHHAFWGFKSFGCQVLRWQRAETTRATRTASSVSQFISILSATENLLKHAPKYC